MDSFQVRLMLMQVEPQETDEEACTQCGKWVQDPLWTEVGFVCDKCFDDVHNQLLEEALVITIM